MFGPANESAHADPEPMSVTYSYLRFKTISADSNGGATYDSDFTSLAEIWIALSGSTLSRAGWSVLAVDSEETGGYEGTNAIDNNAGSMWHTNFTGPAPGQPHYIDISFGGAKTFDAVWIQNRDSGNNGEAGSYEIYGSNTGLSGSWVLIGSGIAQTGVPVNSAVIHLAVSGGGGGTSYTLTADQGSYSVSGQSAGLRNARKMAAAQGSYALNGQVAGLKVGRKAPAAQGSYSLTGQVVGLRAARKILAGQGSYALNGQSATLSKSSVGSSLTADQGSYSLGGQSLALRIARALVSGQGAYSLTGQDATLRAARTFLAAQGSYSLTGVATALRAARQLRADYGIYVLAGISAGLTYSGDVPGPAALDNYVIRARRRSRR